MYTTLYRIFPVCQPVSLSPRVEKSLCLQFSQHPAVAVLVGTAQGVKVDSPGWTQATVRTSPVVCLSSTYPRGVAAMSSPAARSRATSPTMIWRLTENSRARAAALTGALASSKICVIVFLLCAASMAAPPVCLVVMTGVYHIPSARVRLTFPLSSFKVKVSKIRTGGSPPAATPTQGKRGDRL